MLRRKNTKVLRETTNYPGTPAYVIEVISNDIGGSYRDNIPKVEYDLGIYLTKMVNDGKVSEDDMKVLEKLISDYGDEKYEEAADNAAMDAAGADL